MNIHPYSIHRRAFGPLTLSADSLIGDRVVNLHGVELGKVEELMVDLDAGRVAYAIVSTSQGENSHKNYFPLPWDVLSADFDNRCFVTQLDPEILSAGPHFSEKPTQPPQRDWLENIYRYYKVPVYWLSS